MRFSSIIIAIIVSTSTSSGADFDEDYTEDMGDAVSSALDQVKSFGATPESACAQNDVTESDETIPLEKFASIFNFPLDHGECGSRKEIKISAPTANCRMLERNLRRDSNKCIVDPEKALYQKPLQSRKVSGKMRYLGFFPRQYNYGVEKQTDGKFAISLKIHLKGSTLKESAKVEEYLAKAEAFWNQSNPSPEQFRFSFKIVDNAEDADYSVDLKDKDSRGPYDKRWSKDWTETQIRHEVGHMMGLDDEYPQLLVTFRGKQFWDHGFDKFGDPNSVMYSGGLIYKKKPMPYHYYLIFRRAFCSLQ